MPRYTAKIKLKGDWDTRQQIKKRIRGELQKIGSKHAERVRDEAVRMMKSSKSGRHHLGLPNRSSAPGEAPAVQSGALARSIKVTTDRASGVQFRVGTPLWYGNHLMTDRNRPALLPALRKEFPSYLEEVRSMIGRKV